MRKIKLQNYLVKLTGANGEVESKPYNVKESIISCFLHPALKLTGRELLLRGKLTKQIEKADDSILVEEEDFRKLKRAFEQIEGFTRNDMELVRRVLEAEEIEVSEINENPNKKLVKGRRE